MDYLGIFYDILGYLGRAVIVIGAFYFGKSILGHKEEKHSEPTTIWKAIGSVVMLAGLIGFMVGNSYGTYTEDADPLYGGGQTVTEFETTNQQKIEKGLTMFFVLLGPALFGVYKGQRNKRIKETNKAHEN